MLKRLFGFDKSQSTIRTEIVAGVTTFLTMAYILAVNPDILSATGMDRGALFTATALASAVATIILAIYAKMPLAQAPGMGINAFFAYTIVLTMGYSWQTALAATFVEGIIFIILTIFNIREKIIECIPPVIRYAIVVGIGLFIAFVGLRNGGVIVGNDVTFVALNTFNGSNLIAIFGILLSGILIAKKVRGALFYSIIGCTIVAIATGITVLPENFSIVSMPQSLSPTLFKLDFSQLLSIDVIMIILLLVFIDIFNTLGTLIGAAYQANMVDENGNTPRMKQALMSDAIGTSIGAVLGTSTVTTFVESSAGIAEGGRSGLTAFTTGVLFLIALFFSPLFAVIPSFATTGALVAVGVFMMSGVKEIDYEDITELMPAVLTILMMVLTCSIADGIALGLASYAIIKLCTGRIKDMPISTLIITLLIVIRYVVM